MPTGGRTAIKSLFCALRSRAAGYWCGDGDDGGEEERSRAIWWV